VKALLDASSECDRVISGELILLERVKPRSGMEESEFEAVIRSDAGLLLFKKADSSLPAEGRSLVTMRKESWIKACEKKGLSLDFYDKAGVIKRT